MNTIQQWMLGLRTGLPGPNGRIPDIIWGAIETALWLMLLLGGR
jgi:hypothetical protein